MSKKVKNQTSSAAVDYKEIAKIAAILAAICLVVTALLAATNELTVERIAANTEAEKAAACQEVIPAPEYVKLDDITQCEVSLAVNGSEVIGCAITTIGKGYGGEITVMTGFDINGNITGVKLVEHSETAGLGANAANSDWLSGNFGGRQASANPFTVDKDGGDVDSVTAATISSRAVTEAVNSACAFYEELSASGKLALPAGYISGGQSDITDDGGADIG